MVYDVIEDTKLATSCRMAVKRAEKNDLKNVFEKVQSEDSYLSVFVF